MILAESSPNRPKQKREKKKNKKQDEQDEKRLKKEEVVIIIIIIKWNNSEKEKGIVCTIKSALQLCVARGEQPFCPIAKQATRTANRNFWQAASLRKLSVE